MTDQLATDDWLLEVYAPDGLTHDAIATDVDEAYDDTPSDFRSAVDETYLDALTEKTTDIIADGRTAILGYDDERQSVTLDDERLVYAESGEPVETGWDDRPTLYAEHDVGDAEKLFWDGDTVVATPRVEDGELVFEAFTGSYAERRAAQDAVDDYAIDRLPLSTNITVVPVLDQDDDPVIPVFYRNDDVAEYPNQYHTVAGGIPDAAMHPLDAGWMEMREEIRVVPDTPVDELADRQIVDEADALRPELLADTAVTPAVGDDAYELLFRATDAMELLGVVRNLETHTPEICAVVETGLDYDVVADNYTRGAEHAAIEPVAADADAVRAFREDRENIIPVGDAAMLLATDYLADTDLVEAVAATDSAVPEPYSDVATRTM
jgi:hypothetical protein